MATKTIEKIMLNGSAYQIGYDSKITIKKNGTKVDDFTLNQSSDKDINISVPTNSDYVDLTSAQSVGGVKTFTSAPVVPSKTTDAGNTGTAVATEAQVYKKQDKLTVPSTPTSGNLVVWGANNKTIADGGAIPTGFNPGNTGDTNQILRKTNGGYEWSDEIGTTYTAGTNIQISNSNVISATDTTYQASDFDIKDLSDSTSLRTTWSGKQDKLTAGTNINIANDGTISATDTTYSEVSKSAMDTGTSTTAGVVSAKSIADYVSGRIGSAVNYKGQVADYDSLPASPSTGDMYNVVAKHTTAPKFDAGTNVVWNGTGWDPMAEMVDLSNLVDKTTNQTIGGVKTFSSEPVLPSKDSAVGTSKTSPATEYQVKAVKDLIPTVNNSTVSFTQAGASAGSLTTNQASASTIALTGNLMKTATEYTNLPSSKNTDGNRYFIYSEASE